MDIILKSRAAMRVPPNLADYDAECAAFTWQAARGWLDGLSQGRGLNIAHETVDRRASGPRAGKAALRWLSGDGATLDLSYAQLHALSNRFANALAGLGVAAGGPVFTLLGRMPALHIALSGALKHRCVVTPVPPQGRGHPQPAAGARARDRRA